VTQANDRRAHPPSARIIGDADKPIGRA